MPKYRLKHDDTMVHVSDHSVTFSRRNDTHGTAFEITRECYFAVKDKIKSFDKKNGNISDTVNNQER